MNPNREELLFQLALTKSADERAAFLDRECGSDAALRARLEALLVAHEQPDTLLATQAEAARPTIKLELADAPDEAVGQTLGRYKLLERVGEGGCGVVYVAEQTEPVRRRVALKVIKLGMDTKQVVARFLQGTGGWRTPRPGGRRCHLGTREAVLDCGSPLPLFPRDVTGLESRDRSAENCSAEACTSVPAERCSALH